MQVNNVTVPDAGSNTEYIADPIGGWLYTVVTNISVSQSSLTDVQSQLAAAKQAVEDAQATVDELEPQATAFATAVAAQPIQKTPIQVASSTPMS